MFTFTLVFCKNLNHKSLYKCICILLVNSMRLYLAISLCDSELCHVSTQQRNLELDSHLCVVKVDKQ